MDLSACVSKSTQCSTLYDGDNNTCHAVPHNRYPWSLSLKLSVGCIPLKYDGSFNVDVIGKGLVCNDVMFGYKDSEKNQGYGTIYRLCNLTGPGMMESLFVTCQFACHTSKAPLEVFLDIKGAEMEVCDIRYV